MKKSSSQELEELRENFKENIKNSIRVGFFELSDEQREIVVESKVEQQFIKERREK